MKLFNDQAAAAVASLDSADAAYCAKLEQRFAHMGISSKAASSAVQSLVEAGVPEARSPIPDFRPYVKTIGSFHIARKPARAAAMPPWRLCALP